MANTAIRLSANGSLTISGSFDEVSSTYVSSGLLGSWDANRSYYPEIDASTWYDIAGNNNIRIFNNNSTPALFSPSSNSANITFFTTDGSSASLGSYGLVTIPQLATTANVTIEGVLNIRQLAGMIMGFNRWNIFLNGGRFGFNTFQSDQYGISAATVTSLNLLNRNVHYVFVFPTSNLPGAYQLWINGVQQSLSLVSGTGTASSRSYNLFDNTYTFQLNGHYAGTPVNGTIPSAGTYYGNVSWSSFRMYNRVLTPAEIRQNYNIASARYQLGSTINPIVTATVANNVTQNVIQTISGEFDEVTYNPIANVAINLFVYTQDFTNAYWNKRLTITSTNELAPDNTFTATLFTYNLQFALVQTQTNFTNTFGKTYTFSCYVKASTTNIALVTTTAYCNYNVSNGTVSGSPNVGSARITRELNGFYRCSLSFTSNSATEGFGIWLAGFTGGVFTGQTMTVWAPQVEVNTVVTPYQAKGAFGLLQSNTAMKTTNTGNTFIKGSYDEYSKMSPITEGLIFNVDPGYEGSYIGSGPTIYDTTQNRYRVDLNNSPTYSSDFGGTLKFTSTFGNNAWANTNFPARTITPTSNYTMSAWIKLNRSISGLAESNFYNPTTGALVSPQANTGFAYGSAGSILGITYYGDYGLFWYSRIANSGQKQLLIGFQNRVTPYAEASPQLAYTMDNSLIFFNWTHIVGVLNNAGNFAGFYVNGVLVNSTTASQIASGSFPYAISTIRICADNASSGSGIPRNFDGDIGPMCIWNRALSASEIQQMYNSQRSRFGV